MSCTMYTYISIAYKVVGGSYYGNYYETAYKYTCSETSQTLSDCGEISYSLSSNTGSWYRSLGVQCQPISGGLVYNGLSICI